MSKNSSGLLGSHFSSHMWSGDCPFIQAIIHPQPPMSVAAVTIIAL